MSAVPVLRRAPHWFGGYTCHTCLHGVCLVNSRSITPAVPGTPKRPEKSLFLLALLGVSGLPGTGVAMRSVRPEAGNRMLYKRPPDRLILVVQFRSYLMLPMVFLLYTLMHQLLISAPTGAHVLQERSFLSLAVAVLPLKHGRKTSHYP